MMTPADTLSATENHQSDSRNPKPAPGYFWESLGELDKIQWRKVSDAEWNVMMQSQFYAEFSADPSAEQVIREGI